MSSTIDTAVREARQHIGGKWVDAAGGGTFDDLDPYTGDVVARVAAGGRLDAPGGVGGGPAAVRGGGDRGGPRRVRRVVAGRARPAPGLVPQGRGPPRVAPRRGGGVAGQGD